MHSNAEPFSYRADRSESRRDLQMLVVEHFPLDHLLAKLQTQYVGPKLAASHGTLGQRTAVDVGKTTWRLSSREACQPNYRICIGEVLQTGRLLSRLL